MRTKIRFLSLILVSLSIAVLCICMSCAATVTGAPVGSYPAEEPVLSPEPTPIETPAPDETAVEYTDPFSNKIVSPAEEIVSYFPLYAMIPSEEIYLYGLKGDGMILYQQGRGTYFDWPQGLPWRVLPQLTHKDFDDDGKKELAIILFIGAGTGVAAYDLHIIKDMRTEDELLNGQDPIYVDYSLLAWDVSDWMTEPLTAGLAEDHDTFVFGFCGETYTVTCLGEDAGAFSGVMFSGHIVNFQFEDNRIKTMITVGAIYENYVTPQYFGNIEAYVAFDGEGFALEDHSFSLYPDYK